MNPLTLLWLPARIIGWALEVWDELFVDHHPETAVKLDTEQGRRWINGEIDSDTGTVAPQ